MGITFKENCPDSRNTKVLDIIRKLEEYGICVEVVDPVADERAVKEEYGIPLFRLEEIRDADAVIVAVAHDEFVSLELNELKILYKPGNLERSPICNEVAATQSDEMAKPKLVLIDVKGIFDRKQAEEKQYLYWRL